MIEKVQVGCQFFDSGISCVHNVNLIPIVDGDVAGLHESFVFGPAAPKRDEGRVVICDVEKQRTIFDGSVENENLEKKVKL